MNPDIIIPHILRKSLPLLSLLVIAGASRLHADLTIVMDEDGEERISYFSKGKSAEYLDGMVDTIIDLKKDHYVSFNHSHKAYMQGKFSEMPKILEEQLQAHMSALLDNPMVQAMMAQQQQEAAKTKIEVKKGDVSEIAGYKYESHKVLANGKPAGEKWVSKQLANDISKEFDFDRFRKTLNAMDLAINSMVPQTPQEKAEQDISNLGFVVYSAEAAFMGIGPLEVTEKLVSVSKDKIDASVFSAPQGYNELPLAEFIQLGDEEDEEDWEDDDNEGDWEDDSWEEE